MIKESSSFYPQQQTVPLCLISKYITAVATAHYGHVASRNFNYYCRCTSYSEGHFDSCCSKSFFFPPIEMGLVDNSILLPINALALKCTDKYYEVSIWLTIWGIKIAFVKLCFSKIMCLIQSLAPKCIEWPLCTRWVYYL